MSQEGTPPPGGEEGSQAGSPAPSQPAPRLYQVDLEQYILHRNVAKAITAVEFDVAAEHGQARRLDESVVEAHADSFKHKLPKDRLKVTLWPTDGVGMLVSLPPSPSSPTSVPQARSSLCCLAPTPPRRC